MRNSLAFLVVGSLVACGGSSKGPESPAGGGAAGGGGTTAKAGPGDVSFEVPAFEVKGLMFEPEALGSPGMPLAEAKKKTTLDKQRAAYDKAAKGKDVVMRQAQAAVLATMLYLEAKNKQGEEQKKLWNDARQVLRESIEAAGPGKADETDLRMLASYELLLEDFAGAEKAWAGLIAADPKSKDLATNKAWLAYSQLRQYKTDEALQTLGGEAVTEKTPELAYVTAWAKFRKGDDKGAWAALVLAAKGGKDLFPHDAMARDLLLFAGRTSTKMADAASGMAPYWGKGAEYEMYAKLGLESYQYAGRWADGVAALDKAMTVGGPVPVNDLPVIRYEQADYTVRLDDPKAAAKFAVQAVEALPACGAKCSAKDMNTVVYSVYLMGRLFHVLYATAHDDRYYQPAHDIYQATVSKLTDDKQRAEGTKDADALERSFKAMKAGVGTHDKAAIGALLARHVQEVQACYERALGANPKLSGTLTLNLESDQTGVIKGVSTEPKAGMEGISAVAGCVEARAKSWKLSTRAQAGATRMKLSYSLAPATPAK
jgi:hypothetical protein